MIHRWLPALLSLLAVVPLQAQVGGSAGDTAASAADTAALAHDTIPRVVPLDTIRAPRRAGSGELFPDLFDDIVDLGMRITGRGELGGAWSRFSPCDPTLLLNCNPGLMPLLKPEVQFGVQIAGTVAHRIHIDVDYDQRREFGAANNINVYYQGMAGEVLQRLEIGDVSIRLPASRYLTEGVPGGNFGFKAAGQFGPVDVQTIWAQQKGDIATREFRLGGLRGSAGLVQEARLTIDDADYVKGQFFFLVDPAVMAGYPHIDVLSLGGAAAPAWLRPARGGEIQLYRDERQSLVNLEQRAQLGYFLAEGVAADGVARHRGRFRRLIPGEDYRMHPSGLWFMLRAPLRGDEALAAAFVTESGAVIGTLDAEAAPPGMPPELLLLRGPDAIHQPGFASWRFEMHQVYRLDGSAQVEPGSVDLDISLGEPAGGLTFRQFAGRPLAFLKLLGLDEDLPTGQLDQARLFQPARGGALDGSGSGRFGGSYLILPTLRPFAEPPAVPSVGLSAADVATAFGADLNPAIYDDPDPVLRAGGARFRLDFRYRLRTDGVVSTFGLGAFGIREGSERLTLGGRALHRGVDYTIDYDLGQVTLTNAPALLASNPDPDAELRATWEQKSIFQIAPRTLFGLSAHYPVGTAGGLNLVGIYQAEKQLLARPQLGVEPGNIFLGGANGTLSYGIDWLDNLLGGLGGADAAGSQLRLGGEIALSLPNPNGSRATYLDDFEAGDDLPLSLDQRLWHLGSRPSDGVGATGVLPDQLDVTTAAPLIWQHELLDDAGRIMGPRLAREIDRQIQLAGAQRTEPVLYLTFGNGQVSRTTRSWRSLTTVLSTTGRDMSRSEYLEFYAAAAPGQELALILDIGSLSEDAFYFDDEGRTEGEYPDGRRWGLGTLDEEARLGEGEIWSAYRDSLGLWNQPCLAEPGRRAYRAGDPRANCTRRNGEIDTEDLDGDGILTEQDGAAFRYLIRLDASSPYLVRDRSATGTEFSLYRIPLRGPGALALNGATDGSWRYMKFLRLTVAGRAGLANVPDIALARVRIVGSRWAKRGMHGVMAGLTDDLPGIGASFTDFQVGTASRITDGAGYVSPPGVADQVQDPTSLYGSSAVEYNEKSLRLSYRDLEPGDRAEVYFRYPQQARSLLAYREIRLWALARAGRWGGLDAERLVVSIGTDSRNRYLYQTPLRPAPPGTTLLPEAWLPELTIDFEEWFELKARAEAILLSGAQLEMGPLVLWDQDSTYGIILEDRARAPNLAAVREIAFAVYNAAGLPATGEVWIDDMRLGGAVRDAGLASHWEMAVSAGDFASAGISYGSRGGLFRQLDGEATYRATAELGVNGTAQLGKLAPAGWALDMPVTVSHARTGYDPTFMERSDVRADRLPGLRETGAEQTRLTLSLRRNAPVENPWVGWLLSGASLRLGYQTATASAITSRDDTRGADIGVGYTHRPTPRAVYAVPGPLVAVLHALLPRSLEESRIVEGLTSAQFRWTPTEITVSSTYSDQISRSYRFASIVGDAADDGIAPIEAPRRGLETTARIAFQPFNSLTAGLNFSSGRDLLSAERAEVQPLVRQAIGSARRGLGGLDLGWERQRTLESRLEFRPMVTSWLRPGIGYTARFRGDRHASQWERLVVDDDTTAVLQRHYQADRRITRSLSLDPEALGRALAGAPAGTAGDTETAPDAERPGGTAHALATLLRALRPIDLAWSDGVDSRFERETLGPGFGYQFGLGGYDAFRGIQRDAAAHAQLRSSFRARGGLSLPLRAQLDFGYLTSMADSYERGGGRYRVDERSWPDLMLTWTELPVPDAIRGAISHSTASLGYQRTTRAGRPGQGMAELRTGAEVNLPVRFTIGFANGLSGSYTGLRGAARARDLTGQTEQEVAQHAVQLAGSFAAPGAWRESLEAPVRVALSLSSHARRQCRVPPVSTGTTECVPFVDLVNRQLALTLDTVVSQLNMGFQMSYNDHKSSIGLRSGSSQFQLGLFGEFNFEAGNFMGGRQ